MQIFYAIVHKDAHSAYGVTFPDFPGCFSAADDRDDLVCEAQTALSLFLSDEAAELPEARDLASIVAEFKDDLARGAFVLGIPLVTRTRKTRINVMLDPDTVAAADRTAKIAGVTRSQFISEALVEKLSAATGIVTVREARDGKKATSVKSRAKKGVVNRQPQ